MNLLTTLLTLLCLGACGPIAGSDDAASLRSPWGQDRRVARDVEAMMHGIDLARSEETRVARITPNPAIARPGS
jgi:hypothetical protein